MPGAPKLHFRRMVQDEHAPVVVLFRDAQGANHIDISFIDKGFPAMGHLADDIEMNITDTPVGGIPVEQVINIPPAFLGAYPYRIPGNWQLDDTSIRRSCSEGWCRTDGGTTQLETTGDVRVSGKARTPFSPPATIRSRKYRNSHISSREPYHRPSGACIVRHIPYHAIRNGAADIDGIRLNLRTYCPCPWGRLSIPIPPCQAEVITHHRNARPCRYCE